MLDNPDSTMSLKRSKAVGEPPLLLGLSVWAAVKNALSYLSPGAPVDLHLPATNEQILMLMNRLQPAGAPRRSATTVEITK
jgi:xanthine dehydrogenase large subunit